MSRPFRAQLSLCFHTQGVALGWYVTALQAWPFQVSPQDSILSAFPFPGIGAPELKCNGPSGLSILLPRIYADLYLGLRNMDTSFDGRIISN